MKKRILLLAAFLLVALLLPLSVSARDVSYENDLATDLRALGLFQGVSETNFDLERAPSRTEVLVMLIRVLGKEEAAKSGEYTHPFTDAPAWADPYVGYAYANNLTKGVSATKFGTDTATAGTYLTFMLRALGYSDANGDFAWDAPETLASGIGLLPPFVDTENFWRADIVSISYAALSVQLKGKPITLAQKLIDADVFPAETLAASYDNTKLGKRALAEKRVLTSEEIFDHCAPAVFYIEVADEKGKTFASGSGFFIREDGIAVTNYHVLEGAASATVTIPATQKKYAVTGIYDFDRFDDWAVVQVDGSGFGTLTADPLPLKTAVTAYAIGSPKGLQNTISAGIISSPRRVLGENGYIQTTAAISGGSSGGALLSVYGEVVGITCGAYAGGQNLNFACPISCIAGAKIGDLTKFADMTWKEVRYYFEEESIALTMGTPLSVEFDWDYQNDGTDFVYVSEKSSDESVFRIVEGLSYGELYLLPQNPGTATLCFANDLTDEVLEIPVTVTGEAASPKVEYVLDEDEDDGTDFTLGVGASDRIYAVALPLGVSGEEITVRSSNEKIATATVTKETDEKNPADVYYCIEFTAVNAGEAEIVLCNDKTADTASFKVTVEDRFPAAYAKLVQYIEEKGATVVDGRVTYTGAVIIEEKGNSLLFLHNPKNGEIVFRLENGVVTADVILARDGKTAKIAMRMPTMNFSAVATVKPSDIGTQYTISNLDSYSGPSDEKEMTKAMLPTVAASVMEVVDMVTYYDIDKLRIADLGFVHVNSYAD